MKDSTGEALKEFNEYFPKLPTEIKLAIFKWSVCKPACHIFKVEKQWTMDKSRKWFPSLRLYPTADPSPYRNWKSLALTCRLGHQALMEEMEENGLRVVRLGRKTKYKAVIDSATDVVILHFSTRGEHVFTCNWAEHVPTWWSRMDIGHSRSLVSNITRLALRYKSDLPNYNERGPFKCRCGATPWSQHSKKFKYCPLQLAGFLDLFRNLEKFYFVMPNRSNQTIAWFAKYQSKVKACNYMVDAVNRDGAIEVEQYSDYKKNYMRILPNPTRNALMQVMVPENDPWSDVEECLSETRLLYRSVKGRELFVTPLDKRRAVHFALLIAYTVKQ